MGCWSAGFAQVREMLEGSWWAPEWQVLLGAGFLVGRASSSWTGFFRHGGGSLWQGLFDSGFLVCMCWAGACE